jgi:hypothetical protein
MIETQNTTEESFNFWMPAQAVVVKGGKKDGADPSGKRWIQGVASTSAQDLQGEKVSQIGIDTSYFMKHGFFNDDHKQGPEFRVGEPTEAKLTKNGLWVKGFLFRENERADKIWKFMNSLHASGSTRKMGFSIEGKVIRRDGQHIEKCWIQNIAVTAAPINTSTWADIVKSLSGNAEKSLVTGGAVGPITKEDLDEDPKTSKGLSFDETVQFLQAKEGMSEEGAQAVAKVVFATYS